MQKKCLTFRHRDNEHFAKKDDDFKKDAGAYWYMCLDAKNNYFENDNSDADENGNNFYEQYTYGTIYNKKKLQNNGKTCISIWMW